MIYLISAIVIALLTAWLCGVPYCGPAAVAIVAATVGFSRTEES